MDAMTLSRHRFRLMGVLALACMFLMTGCEGDTGPAGLAGEAGQDGQAGQDYSTPATEVKVTIASVAVPSPAGVQGTTVDFTVRDMSDNPVTSLPAGASVYFTFAKLTSDANSGLTQWVSYINRDESTASAPNNVGPGGTPVLASALQANRQTATSAVVNLGAGRYRYVFTSSGLTTTIQSTPVAFSASATNRIAVQVSGGGLKAVNAYKDFVPAGGSPTVTRRIATTASCLECHEKNFGFHDSSARVEVEYCVTCHNSGSTDANSGLTVDMANMIHKIHRGLNLPSVVAGGEYAIWGFGGSKHDYSDVGYPQDARNCRKCHSGADAATPDGNNWMTKPSRRACGACHDDLDFATGAGHAAQPNDNACFGCHGPSGSWPVDAEHLTIDATPNNPSIPPSASNFEYIISSVTTTSVAVGATTNILPVVTFRIKRDGADMNLSGTALPTGFTSGPSFLIAYAAPQDGVAASADWNQNQPGYGAIDSSTNALTGTAQPNTVRLADVRNGSQGAIVDNGDGTYTATLRGVPSGEIYRAAFPANATMRAVGLQGAFTQGIASGVTATISRTAKSVIKGVTGDPARRVVVDNDKCLACHERLQLHGGSRVDETAICVTCHNPNLSSSGRGADPALITALYAGPVGAPLPAPYTTGTTTRVTQGAYDAAQYLVDELGGDPLNYPEATNNFKDMIHGIHASHFRTTDYKFVRDRSVSGVYYYNWHHVTYPSDVVYCEKCHKPGTYGVELPAGVLASNNITGGDGLLTRAAVTGARLNTPNAADQVISPTAAACYACHDSALAKAHMTQNGGYIGARNAYATVETCIVCHGAGRSADVTEVHKQ